MVSYINAVMVLSFLVNWLLLMGANHLGGCSVSLIRTAAAASLGGLHSGLCFLPSVSFLGNVFWRVLVLILIAVSAFGYSARTLCRTLYFLLLSFALGGITSAMQRVSGWTVLMAAGGICVFCLLSFRKLPAGTDFVPVELSYGTRRLELTALLDTGNTLIDPISGGPVLVLDEECAGKLTGLSRQQLEQPLETMTALPGLRLIPYRSVGVHNGFLLGMLLQDVKIGSWKGSRVVAFAPQKLSLDGTYQALTGGSL